jgi:CRP/FNR family transcriptional regulator, anaerobic regulatory protein
LFKEQLSERHYRCGCPAYEALLERFDASDERIFREATRTRKYATGRTLFSQGQECQELYFVRSGLIGLRRSDEDGNSALLRLNRAGDVLGYRAIAERSVHQNTAEVLTSSEVLIVSRSIFQWLARRNAWLNEHILRFALHGLSQAEAICAELLTARLKERLLSLLAMFDERSSEADEMRGFQIELPIQRKDLADLLGTNPASLSRTIARLQKDGDVRFTGRRVHVLNPRALRTEVSRFWNPN